MTLPLSEAFGLNSAGVMALLPFTKKQDSVLIVLWRSDEALPRSGLKVCSQRSKSRSTLTAAEVEE